MPTNVKEGTKSKSAQKPDLEELLRAYQAAERNYRRYPNVVGISAGVKFTGDKQTQNHDSIVFYVSRKMRRLRSISRCLPKFIYGRFRDGTINRRQRFATDVIKVGRVTMACGAGSPIDAFDGSGAISFLFRNKTASNADYYLVSCSHVIGDLAESPPTNPDLTSKCRPNAGPFAQTIVNAVSARNNISYDIAIARVRSTISSSLKDLIIANKKQVITGFFTDEIRPPMNVECALPASGEDSGVITARAGSVDVIFRKKQYSVSNAYVLRARVEPGDSGGLVYQDDLAVGIVFARSPDNWAWFQRCDSGFQFLQGLCRDEGLTISAF